MHHRVTRYVERRYTAKMIFFVLCSCYSKHLKYIIAFLSKDGGGDGKAEGMANQTDGSAVCSNIMNCCFLCNGHLVTILHFLLVLYDRPQSTRTRRWALNVTYHFLHSSHTFQNFLPFFLTYRGSLLYLSVFGYLIYKDNPYEMNSRWRKSR